MHETIKKMVHSFEKQREQRRRVYAAFTALAILVSVSTTYLLVQPASTMAADYICGMEEHIHTEDCYEEVLICGHGGSTGGVSGTEAPVEEEIPEEEVIQETPSEDVDVPKEEVETPAAPSEDEAPAQQEQTTPEPSVETPAEVPESEEPVTETSPAPEETPVVEELTEETSVEEPAEESTVQETPAASEPAAEEPENDTSDSGTIEESLVMNSYGPEDSGDSADESDEVSSEPAEESESEEPADAEETNDADDEESETVSEDAEDASEDTGDADEEVDEASEEESDSAGGHVHTQACYKKVLVCDKEEHVHDESCLSQSLMMLLPEGAEIPEGYDQEYTYIDSDNRFAVAVYAPDGALPEGAQLVAELLEEGSDAHAVAEEALAAMAAKEIEVNVGGVMSEAALEEAAATVSAEPEEVQTAVEAPAADEAEAAVEAESADTSESAEPAEDSGESVEASDDEQETEVMDEEPADVEPSGESEGTMTASLIHNDAAPDEETGESVEETTEEIIEAAEEEEESASYKEEFSYDGFVALDIHFELDGEEIEPEKPVFVCINVKGLLPEEADPDSVTILHQKETVTETEESVVESMEVVADSTENTGILETTESNADAALDVSTLFAVDSFSTFIATYLAKNNNELIAALIELIGEKLPESTDAVAALTTEEADAYAQVAWQAYYAYTKGLTTEAERVQVTNRQILLDLVAKMTIADLEIDNHGATQYYGSKSDLRTGGNTLLKYGDDDQENYPNVLLCTETEHVHDDITQRLLRLCQTPESAGT